MDLSYFINKTAWVLPVIFAVTLHEAAHGWVAEKFGDNTARKLGRVTFNPLKHIDKFGTIILPLLLLLTKSPILFGYAKPVPVNFQNLKPQNFAMFAVAIAGPAVNILQAILSALLIKFAMPPNLATSNLDNMPWLQQNLINAISINCALAVFNMLPILPLDGGRVLRAILPGEIGNKYAGTERYGMLIVMGFLFILPMLKLDFFVKMLGSMTMGLVSGILSLTGN